MASTSTKGWKVKATNPPRLSQRQWGLTSLLGVILVVMAVIQLITFGDFRDNLSAMGLSSPTTWAVLVVAAELWGAANFFKLRLSHLFRVISSVAAVLAAGFWFVATLQVVANGTTVKSNAFLGGWLNQQPGWWTVIEATVLLFWVIYAVSLTWPNQTVRR